MKSILLLMCGVVLTMPVLSAQDLELAGDPSAWGHHRPNLSGSVSAAMAPPSIFLVKDALTEAVHVHSVNPICWIQVENQLEEYVGVFYTPELPAGEWTYGEYRLCVHFKDGSVSYQTLLHY